MLFSIVVPVYNAEKYLHECIKSVLNQTYKGYELILVDDGSTDSSGRIIDEYKEKYPNIIKVIHKENGGQFSARKKGIDISTGEYILSLDADDCLKANALEVVNKYIINAGYPDILFHKCSVKEDYSHPLVQYNFIDGEIFTENSKHKIYCLLLATPNLNSFCCKAYKASLLKSAIWDDVLIGSISNGEDLLQEIPLFTVAEKIVYCDYILYFYRLISTSVSHTYSPTLYSDTKTQYEELKKHITIWGVDKSQGEYLLNNRILKDMCNVLTRHSSLDKKTCIKKLSEIADDSWYKELYENADKKLLNYKRRILLYLTYKGYAKSVYLLLKLRK